MLTNGNELTIFTDGGSRGNPGPSAGAFIVYSKEKELYKESKFFGVGTNNNAEYNALLLAVEWLKKRKIKIQKINFFLDSELVVKQMTGVYSIKDLNIKSLVIKIKNIEKEIGSVKFVFKHIKRSQNKEADSLVNECLDRTT